MNTPERIFLGWDRPAIELVAEKLLEGLSNPQTAAQYRRATVVVPTEGSGRRLREYMAEKAGKALLMPSITLAGHLIPDEYPGAATEMETLTAWLQVLSAEGADPVAQYAPLIPAARKHTASAGRSAWPTSSGRCAPASNRKRLRCRLSATSSGNVR